MIATQTRRRTKTIKAPLEMPLTSFLDQAEVCREQARDAARMKRFRAAIGLFLTAANLCRHARNAAVTDNEVLDLANERLEQIDLEMATYTELAKSHHVI
jgi:hypothetical protein